MTQEKFKHVQMSSQKMKKELQSFLGLINYLSKFSTSVGVCKPLQKLTSGKADWTWRRLYPDLYNRTKKIVKKDACMKFYDVARFLYLETNASSIDLGARILEVRDSINSEHEKVSENTILHPMTFSSSGLSSSEWCYSNIECETLGVLHGLGKFHHHCFAKKVCAITHHKILMAILNKDVATMSQWLHHIMLRIHKYRLHIIYKTGPDLYIADWLSQNNHAENKDQKTAAMSINVNVISTSVNMSVYTSTEDIEAAT